MNQEWKAKWLEALRSGEYKQCREKLRDNQDKFCCLGVFCDIYDPDRWDLVSPNSERPYLYYGGLRREASYIPGPIRKEVGLSLVDCRDLSSMNDERQMSFAEIADYIEVNL